MNKFFAISACILAFGAMASADTILLQDNFAGGVAADGAGKNIPVGWTAIVESSWTSVANVDANYGQAIKSPTDIGTGANIGGTIKQALAAAVGSTVTIQFNYYKDSNGNTNNHDVVYLESGSGTGIGFMVNQTGKSPITASELSVLEKTQTDASFSWIYNNAADHTNDVFGQIKNTASVANSIYVPTEQVFKFVWDTTTGRVDYYLNGVLDGNYTLANNASYNAPTYAVIYTQDASSVIDALSITTVPEPATMALLALGGLAALRRRKRA